MFAMEMTFICSPIPALGGNNRKRSRTCQLWKNSMTANGRDNHGTRAVPSMTKLNHPSTALLAEEMVSQGRMKECDAKLFMMLSESRANLFAKVLQNRSRHITFALDGVFGAHNLAAIIRSCDAWGLQDLHVIAQPDEYLPNSTKGSPETEVRSKSIAKMIRNDATVRRVSKSSDKWVTIKEYEETQSCLRVLRQAGYRIIVSSIRRDAKSIHDVDLSTKCAFVLGNERHGVTAEMELEADEFFTIPMMGFVESMNVSVAAGNIACLATTKCRNEIRDSDYLISRAEQRDLAHTWLMKRFNSKKTPRPVIVRRDVTKIGHGFEQRVVREGMFAIVEGTSLSGSEFWPLAIRLSGTGGVRVVNEFMRRKAGALGDESQEKRCESITYFLSSTHALSCESALSHSGAAFVTRKTLYEFFQNACAHVHQLYSPNFDQFGVPLLPANFEEAGKIFDELSRSAPKTARRSCLQFASVVLHMSEDDVIELVRKADAADVVGCITDMTRCGEQRASELQSIAQHVAKYEPAVGAVLQERHVERDVNRREWRFGYHGGLDQNQRDCLQVFLRLWQTAFLCSETYQTVWDRHIKRSNVLRIRSLDFNILESLTCDAFQEMQMLQVSYETALARVVFEWERALFRLKEIFGDSF